MDCFGDDPVIATNDDAASCKFQAVQKGYYKDQFLKMLLPPKLINSMNKKAPEINRGYYARSASIAFLVEQFIHHNPSSQIISIGAGYDSLFWRLEAGNFLKQQQDDPCSSSPRLPEVEPSRAGGTSIKYTEIDLNLVVFRKISAIKRQKILANHLSNMECKNESLFSDHYNLVSYDLRKLDKSLLSKKLFEECKLDPSIPTLCLSECVLVYMPINDSNSLLKWLADTFADLTFINYEQCNMEDKFGEIMLNNLIARHCELLGVDACKSLHSQKERFSSAGLTFSDAWTLADIYDKHLLPGDIERIESLELLDEKELLGQLLEHYCIVIASNKKLDWPSENTYWSARSL